MAHFQSSATHGQSIEVYRLSVNQKALRQAPFPHKLSGHAGNIAAWKKKEGEEVAAGDSIAEIETDKARTPPAEHLRWSHV